MHSPVAEKLYAIPSAESITIIQTLTFGEKEIFSRIANFVIEWGEDATPELYDTSKAQGFFLGLFQVVSQKLRSS